MPSRKRKVEQRRLSELNGTAKREVQTVSRVYYRARTQGKDVDLLLEVPGLRFLKKEVMDIYLHRLDELQFFVPGVSTEADVFERAAAIWRETRARPVPVSIRQHSLEDSITNALMEIVGQDIPPSLRQLSDRYKINRTTLTKYRDLLGAYLRLKPPLTREEMSSKVHSCRRQVCSALGWPNLYFTYTKELYFVGVLKAFERASLPLDRDQFLALVRDVLHKRDGVEEGVVVYPLEKWFYGFIKNYKALLSERIANHLSFARAIAQDSRTIDQWISEVHTTEQFLTEERKLPLAGFQAFQILNYDEAATDVRHFKCSSSMRVCSRVTRLPNWRQPIDLRHWTRQPSKS